LIKVSEFNLTQMPEETSDLGADSCGADEEGNGNAPEDSHILKIFKAPLKYAPATNKQKESIS
jgi:hypothetical protein